MNKAILIGNLTRDPELRFTSGGIPVCNFTIAVNRRQKDAGGNQVADFLNITVWRQLGETCAKYLAKGRKVCVVGEIRESAYQDSDGTQRKRTQIVASEITFLTPKSQTAAQADAYSDMGMLPPITRPEDCTEIDDDELPF